MKRIICIGLQVILGFLSLSLYAQTNHTDLVRKTVRQYALTSANDFPQRDPMNWQLLGSPNGQDWVVLDVRHGELFPNRHQRRLFRIAKSQPCNAYRLEILSVRTPASANSVHLAEIEPLGENEEDFDPVPCLEDIITVQGENAPLESRYQAFDSQTETKWLDFANAHPTNRSTWIQWQYVWQPNILITNIHQLQGLRSRASAGYPVRIDGILANRLKDTNVLCFLDAAGYMEIPGGDDARYTPGQPLLLQGVSQWLDKKVTLNLSHITPLQQALLSDPRRVELEEPLSPEGDMQWVEAEGVVQFIIWRDNRLSFELAEDNRQLSVQILHWIPGNPPPVSGQRVRVRGFCSGSLNVQGQRVLGLVRVPDMNSIWPINTNKINTSSIPTHLSGMTNFTDITFSNLWQVRQLTPEQLERHPAMKICGVLTEAFGSYIQDDTAGIELWFGHVPSEGSPSAGLGAFVSVEGKAGWEDGHGPVLHVDRIQTKGQGRLPNPKRPNYKDVADGKVLDEWIEIEGVLRSTDGSHLLLDCDGGKLMATIRSAPVSQVKELVDATVRLRGLNVCASDDRGRFQGIQLLVPSLDFVEIVHPAPDPFALPVRSIGSLMKVSGPKGLIHRVKVEGTVTLQRDRKLFLQDATGSAQAIGLEDIVLDSPPGAYHWAFYQSRANKTGSPLLGHFQPGDKVEAAGFPESRDGLSAVLTEALIRKTTNASFIAPLPAAMNDILMGKFDSTLITLNALVLGQEKMGNDLVFEMQNGQTLFQAILPTSDTTTTTLIPGCRVRVTGVCQVESNPFPELGLKIASFKLLLPSPSALTVIDSPSWWTPSRVFAVACGLAIILVIATAWISSLRRQVELRTSQLKAEVEQHKLTESRLAEQTARLESEIEERKKIEAKVEEGHKQLVRSSHLAGMAEVATSVLHNVGNVLNSSNMLASVLAEQVHNSKVPTLVKTVNLLHEHRDNLADYLTNDERGRHIPLLLEQLSNHLEQDRSRSLERVDALAESVHHIREIVAMQQKYARLSTQTETVEVTEVVEDALRMSSGSFSRNGIEIIREYQQGLLATVDRHKILQILFNLLENARYACVEAGLAHRQVKVKVHLSESNRISISVTDNGIGIASENLSRLFSQGFFMRKEGHGFGLHSSALAAQDIGGVLEAQSAGAGLGASFTLNFPPKPPTA